jgi:hypothetical protein
MSLALLTGIAHLIPGALSLLKGNRAGEFAQKAVDIAQAVSGATEPEDALSKIQNDPALFVEYQKALQPTIVAELAAETAQLESINQTMRAEYAQDDLYTKRWRPTYGYCMAITWTLQMLGFTIIAGWAVVKQPTQSAQIIQAIASMIGASMVLWGVALSVLGIQVSKRSDEKAMRMGHKPPEGIMSALATRIGGNRGK